MQGPVETGMGLGLRLRLVLAAGLVPLARRFEELPGVFGGRFSRSRSAAFSAISASTRANSVRISASFSVDDSEEKSGGGVIES